MKIIMTKWCSSTAPLVKVAVCLLLETADRVLAATSLEELMTVMKVELPGLSADRLEDVISQVIIISSDNDNYSNDDDDRPGV